MDRRNANEDVLLSLGDHLEELRTRLILAIVGLVIGVAICLIFGKWIMRLMLSPYEQVRAHHPSLPALAFLAPADAFVAYMKVCLVAGLILSAPWVFYHLWMFLAVGLYPQERRYVYVAIPFCVTLFTAGAAFFMLVIGPISLEFFVRFGEMINVTPLWMLKDYISFMTMMTLVFGISFQTPGIIFVLNKTGLVSLQTFRAIRKYALLAAFIIGAVATPSVDIFSQVALAVPLYLLYELGIILCLYTNRKQVNGMF